MKHVLRLASHVVNEEPFKFFGPHLGLAFGRAELLERWRPYKVRPAADEIDHLLEELAAL